MQKNRHVCHQRSAQPESVTTLGSSSTIVNQVIKIHQVIKHKFLHFCSLLEAGCLCKSQHFGNCLRTLGPPARGVMVMRMVAAIIVGESALEPPGRQNEDLKMTPGVQTSIPHYSTIFHLEFLTNALQDITSAAENTHLHMPYAGGRCDQDTDS